MPSIELKLRDRTYTINTPVNLSEIKMVPLATVLGTDKHGRPIQPGTPLGNDYAELVLQRLSDPSNHYRLAYSLKALIPELDPLLCDYRLILLPNGSKQEDVTFNLTVEEILQVFSQLQQVTTTPKAGKPKPVQSGQRR
ncbi:MAG: hypothetical protein KME45_03420 [Stenomitos rutilans HA7619-LM2]|jgi:hypothetical protein|nr:hypothetical protein [Stenomitos rutilans HA7619-LM2]MBW4469435.1 hypothetical protein [Stenomitos rutilans HA7619-LM2]